MAHLASVRQPFRDISLRVTSDAYTFTSPSSPEAPCLVLERPTGDIRLLLQGSSAASSSRRAARVSSIVGILGVIQLRLDKYAVVITKAQPVGRLKGNMVYKVAATEIMPMRERQIHDPDEDTFLSLLEAFLATGPLFFSYSLDLTNSFQRQAHADTARPLWARADDRFFFNKYLQSPLIAFRRAGSRGQPGPQPAIDPYILPCIFGMLEIRPTKLRGTPLTVALVSRRSRYRGGTRYFTRGVDEDGHAANYNETEQVVILNDNGSSGLGGFAGSSLSSLSSSSSSSSSPPAPSTAFHPSKETQILSYVQTRGSVPTYWVEVNSLRYTPKIQVRGTDAALAASAKHFDEQIRIYGDNYLVNLVNHKGRESAVKDSYEKMAKALASAPPPPAPDAEEKANPSSRSPFDRLHYVYFDYHSETRGMRMDKANAIVDRLRPAVDAQGYFRGVDMPADNDGRIDPRSLQTSVMRTNCMDCLDRTNVVQSIFARNMLHRQLADAGLLPPSSSSTSFAPIDPAFELLFRNIWADNADVISRAYSGTGAMKTDVTRTGKRTHLGALQDGRIGITRYCLNNFLDGPRQDSFDLFLGAYQPAHSAIGTSLIFADRRPAPLQAVPYLMAFAILVLALALVTRRDPDASLLPIRLLMLLSSAAAAWSSYFVWSHGMLYVNWPRLVPGQYALDGFAEHFAKARKDPLIGPLVARHEIGLSATRYLNAEEGKKRIE